ncbi:MAG TPA: PA2779 family protein [Noviherbaspirillum sp.]|uniref:PA2779 family protein n=1 Tax=Noviherbaspirillum sp. TaxID=1926288 RepID=UPI002B4A5833|nr:PA2779 family protein [Noviherbaspirillum sp.]HJV86527.1 PA2779 family protein [Noviherbaspirillum sp.]
MIQKLKRAFVWMLLSAFTFVGFTQTVQAAMIGTDQVLAANSGQQNRERIAAALDRPEVMTQLEKMGVNKVDAQERVAALSDSEAATLAKQIDSLPAGGDVVGALVLIFVVLLVTDILGLTKVFPFTRSRR